MSSVTAQQIEPNLFFVLCNWASWQHSVQIFPCSLTLSCGNLLRIISECWQFPMCQSQAEDWFFMCVLLLRINIDSLGQTYLWLWRAPTILITSIGMTSVPTQNELVHSWSHNNDYSFSPNHGNMVQGHASLIEQRPNGMHLFEHSEITISSVTIGV